MGQPESTLRLDKWLWAVRFFKTRALAQDAVQGGKVHIGGQRAKPSKTVKVGDLIEIHKEQLSWCVSVLAIPATRGSAKDASLYYAETEQSRTAREQQIEQARLLRSGEPQMPTGRPNKRDRRMIHQFKLGME